MGERDPFVLDGARRDAIAARICDARGACADAVERNDPEAALRALKEVYSVLDKVPDAQLLYVPGGGSDGFVLPDTARQMVARYGGHCSVCEERIRRGDMMYWVPATREMVCARCSIKEFHGG